jgi:very-short-patch-repair endonuclease
MYDTSLHLYIMSKFTRDFDELVCHFKSQKFNLQRHLEKNYRENVHYVKYHVKTISPDIKQHGGNNRIVYMLTEEAFELFKNSFNFRNKYIVAASEKAHVVRFSMCIEGQTIGFIENAYSGACAMSRQFQIGTYRADLCFTDDLIVVECDEYGHHDRSAAEEMAREEFIKNQGYAIIRYNPNEAGFDLSDVLNRINRRLLSLL